ncbi:NADH dehydrogenase FAD-containing subunit [Halapricum sp. CBA1109]|uniref:NAD(P)/FAD-dependent oxidoreductase n=1 Tax=Halapricum sp. CBA1109 TaxID=2668068 RepID=UPI0012F73F0A|nr:FAD-dependent oxidoreductase [Halapricum sp. CBA1109]MUV90964.1 NADH dehydrogenase FAD-containing subunit [Halapricum sp. CBA1109]
MRVAVFGAGYAGVPLVRQLEQTLPPGDEIVVFDDSPVHVVRHEIHRVVRRPAIAEDIAVPFTDLFDRAEVRQERLADIDHEAEEATLDDGTTVEYDAAAVCTGVETEFYGLPGVREHATPLRTIAHAERIREEFLPLAEADEGEVIVGGAGLSGIQVAGELAALAREEGAEGVTIRLLEQADTVAPGFPTDIQGPLREELEARDVVVETGRTVTEADADTVSLADGTEHDYDQLVWTGGVRGTDVTDGERPVVRSTLQLGDRTFAVGDAARVIDEDGQAAPATAHTAVRQGPVAAENIARLLAHDRSGGDGFEPRLERYNYDQLGWLVSVGDGAVAKVGPTVLRGAAAYAVKSSVGAGYLTSVGAVTRAVDLVREEFGLAAGE